MDTNRCKRAVFSTNPSLIMKAMILLLAVLFVLTCVLCTAMPHVPQAQAADGYAANLLITTPDGKTNDVTKKGDNDRHQKLGKD